MGGIKPNKVRRKLSFIVMGEPRVLGVIPNAKVYTVLGRHHANFERKLTHPFESRSTEEVLTLPVVAALSAHDRLLARPFTVCPRPTCPRPRPRLPFAVAGLGAVRLECSRERLAERVDLRVRLAAALPHGLKLGCDSVWVWGEDQDGGWEGNFTGK